MRPEVRAWTHADVVDVDAKLFRGLLERGIYLAPSQFEAGFLSAAHSEADIEKTVRAAANVLKRL